MVRNSETINDLHIDVDLHERIGMTIISRQNIHNKTTHRYRAEFPVDELYNPRGITLEEAQAAVKLCHYTDRK